jgi:hypothetical protein
MIPPGSIVVMLFRPRARLEGAPGNERWIAPDPGAPWMLDDGGGTIEAIAPTPELEVMLPGGQGVSMPGGSPADGTSTGRLDSPARASKRPTPISATRSAVAASQRPFRSGAGAIGAHTVRLREAD